MSKQITIDEESYKKLQAALMLTEESEEIVIFRLINEYVKKAFACVMGEPESNVEDQEVNMTSTTEDEQKQLFQAWFQSLTRNGRPYNPVTIIGYTGRIENACCDPVFESVPASNLFAVTSLVEFMAIQKQIKKCEGFAEFDARSHSGFTAALRKYEEFLRFQAGGNSVSAKSSVSRPYYRSSGVHRWTMEEDSLCCKRFLECYVIGKRDMDTVLFLQKLAKEVPEVSEGSLRMKIQNVRYLSVRAGYKDTSTLKYLTQYSSQCERAFIKTVRELEASGLL